ncbi:MAG: ABC transporter permease subunit [Chloroflexi bacterium]|nr:ABC transporter permease subunit [Chloroflexota bacterium]
MQSVPSDQYEAADVDGATWWDKLSMITLPLIRPADLTGGGLKLHHHLPDV